MLYLIRNWEPFIGWCNNEIWRSNKRLFLKRWHFSGNFLISGNFTQFILYTVQKNRNMYDFRKFGNISGIFVEYLWEYSNHVLLCYVDICTYRNSSSKFELKLLLKNAPSTKKSDAQKCSIFKCELFTKIYNPSH